MKKNILLTIEYDGTVFSGWQRQPDRITVQGMLESALSFICRQKITVDGTSRTDAGVHAYGQRATFCGEIGIPTDKLAFVLNNTLATENYGREAAGAVRIVKAEEVPLDFHARFDSKGKKYIYKIINGREISVFERNYYYHVKQPINTDIMAEAAALICGTHDFKCFQASGGEEKETTVRTITSLAVVPHEDEQIHINVSGDGFLYNMVRIITGTLVDIGSGRKDVEDVPGMIDGRDRCAAGHTAPPQGLYLAEVYYDKMK